MTFNIVDTYLYFFICRAIAMYLLRLLGRAFRYLDLFEIMAIFWMRYTRLGASDARRLLI